MNESYKEEKPVNKDYENNQSVDLHEENSVMISEKGNLNNSTSIKSPQKFAKVAPSPDRDI